MFSQRGYFLLLDRLHETLEDKIQEWAAKESMIMASAAPPSPAQGKSSSKKRRSASSKRIFEGAVVGEVGLSEREREKMLSERIGGAMIDIARGMEYLHLHRIIFRDLKVSFCKELFSGFVFALF